MDLNSKAPTIVFCNPENPRNIGSVSRAMKNFGLDNLRIVGRVLNENEIVEAKKLAAHAENIIDQHKSFSTISEALADKKWVIGLTAGDKIKNKPLDLFAATNYDLWGDGIAFNDVAILLGNESSGLSVEERALCSRLIKIPVSREYESMNVAMAGTVYLFYSWVYKAGGLDFLNKKAESAQSLKEMHKRERESPEVWQKENITKYYMETLEKTSFFKFPDKSKVQMRIKRMIDNWDVGDLLFFAETLYHINAKVDGEFGTRDFLKKRE